MKIMLWDNFSRYEKDELNKIQNKAARIATGTTKPDLHKCIIKKVLDETPFLQGARRTNSPYS